MLASWTTIAKEIPKMSTAMCCFLSLIFLLPSMPLHFSTWCDVLTLRESIIPRLGHSCRPSNTLIKMCNRKKNSSKTPSFFHLLKFFYNFPLIIGEICWIISVILLLFGETFF